MAWVLLVLGVIGAFLIFAAYASVKWDLGNKPFLVFTGIPAAWVSPVLAAHLTGACKGGIGSGIRCGSLGFLEGMSAFFQMSLFFGLGQIAVLLTIVFWLMAGYGLLARVMGWNKEKP